jgi:DsbC/DsbD-like thiol-disulfide interchange protein
VSFLSGPDKYKYKQATQNYDLFGDFTVDIPMATLRSTEWGQGEEEDRQRLQQAIELGEHTYWKRLGIKKDTGRRAYN